MKRADLSLLQSCAGSDQRSFGFGAGRRIVASVLASDAAPRRI